ncbi:ABC transporter permease [Mariprofundus ferrooxydans]|uniref:ABC transporter permease n=1 Tax=Mariprofundus ferrooxydans TaxID=314344 RepID=UPI001430B107|nr:ABC transporter permease [Mariprofundus ferrooxydans]
MKEVIYTPDSSLANPFKMVRAMYCDLGTAHGLAKRLATRDISAQYRQSLLGILWAFILPLATTVVWIVLNGSGIVSVGETPIPYAAYVFSGTMLWAILTEAINSPLQATNAGKSMLTKINFPREALLLSGAYQILFNAIIKTALMLVALIVIGVYPGWSLLLFPFAILSLVIVGLSIGLIFTPVAVLWGDIGRIIPVAMQFLMYFTPVIFAMPKEGFGLVIFEMNPFTPLILTARDWLTGMTPEFLGYFIVVNVAALGLLIFGLIIYRLAMPILIERMSS